MENEEHIPEGKAIEILISDMTNAPENFKHLKIFLHRKRENNIKQDLEFIMITPNAFGKVKLLNLNVEGTFVIIDFLDCASEQVGNVKIDVNDNKPQVFFICWQDIKSMVRSDKNIIIDNSELLEFDY